MALKDIWVDKVNGEDVVDASDINNIANAVIGIEGDYIAADQLDGAVLDALAEAKASGEFDGADGDDYILTDEDKEEIKDAVVAEVPLVKAAEQPTIVNSIDEMTDISKVYVLASDMYFYAYKESAGNYNLLKVSEVSFSSRLQNDAEEIISSTAQNAVSGWFPVTYGKYYRMSTTHSDIGRTAIRSGWTRVQLKLADGTIKLYDLNAYPSTTISGCAVYGVDDENAVAMRVQIQVRNSSASGDVADISNASNLKAFYPMIVEGDSAQNAYDNAMNFAYIDGDEEVEEGGSWNNTGMAYNQPVDYEDRIVDLESDMDIVQYNISYIQNNMTDIQNDITDIQNELSESITKISTSMLYESQKYIADDWRIPFVDVFHKLGLGSNHIIPNSYDVWGGTGNDLTQKAVMMSDGIHPSLGDGVIMMYANAIVPQLESVPPLYSTDNEHDDWTGKTILWMGTSIPAGSDPALGVEGIGTTYPEITANKLGAICINIAQGSSCVRINSSAGGYDEFKYAHFIRALSRTTAEADIVQTNWDSIKTNIVDATSTISADDLAIMKAHSFEALLLPYLDGTNPMPDLFVIDHGHNDIRPRGIDGKQDSLVEPTVENIANGILAEDTYMTDNNYANLKTAFNNDLSRIPNIEKFVASVNRNCLIGAINFIITLIYRYNPRARIVIVSDYN